MHFARSLLQSVHFPMRNPYFLTRKKKLLSLNFETESCRRGCIASQDGKGPWCISRGTGAKDHSWLLRKSKWRADARELTMFLLYMRGIYPDKSEKANWHRKEYGLYYLEVNPETCWLLGTNQTSTNKKYCYYYYYYYYYYTTTTTWFLGVPHQNYI